MRRFIARLAVLLMIAGFLTTIAGLFIAFVSCEEAIATSSSCTRSQMSLTAIYAGMGILAGLLGWLLWRKFPYDGGR